MTEKETVKILDEASALLLKSEKRNKQLLTELHLAKKLIKHWFNEAHGDMGNHFWTDYDKTSLTMQRINKAINGK